MSFTKKQSDPETLDFPFPSTPEQFKAYLKDRQSKLDAMIVNFQRFSTPYPEVA